MPGRIRSCMLLLLLLALAAPAIAAELVLGVFAFRPKEVMIPQYQPLADYLSHIDPDLRVRLRVLTQDEMEAALRNNELDLLFTNPSHFLLLRHQQRISGAIATLESREDGKPTNALGGVIFTLASQEGIRELADLRGKRIAMLGSKYLGGYQTQAYELQQAGIHLPQDAQLVVVRGGHDAVIEAVLQGRAQVGFVRTGMLESWVRAGRLDLASIRVINRQHWPGFPYITSTRLYPEWAFAAMPHVDDKTARRIAAALFEIKPDSPVARAAGIEGFTIPADYLPVEELARSLRMPPFAQAPQFTVGDIWSRFSREVVAMLLLASAVVLLAGVLVVTNRRLKRERARATSIIEGTNAGTWEWNVQTGALQVNVRWAQIAGYTLQELAPISIATWQKLAHPDDLKKSEALLLQHFRGETDHYACECRVRHKQGHWVWVLDRGKVSARSRDGKPLNMSGTHIDITPLKESEERSRMLAVALEAAGNGIVITDRDGRIEWANPAFFRLTGYGIGETMGQHPGSLLKSGEQDDAFYSRMWSTILAGREWRGELINRHKDGHLYHAFLTITPVRDRDGVIRRFVGIEEDISERKRMEEDLRHLATTDYLTGLPNRRHFLGRLEEELARLRRMDGHMASLVMLDLDHFKRINDGLGHAAGDAVLRHFANLLSCDLRDTDIAGRLGGEEFAILLPGATLEDAVVRAERLRRLLQQSPLQFGDDTVRYTLSAGVVQLAADATGPDHELSRVDAALYRAKQGGRDQVAC